MCADQLVICLLSGQHRQTAQTVNTGACRGPTVTDCILVASMGNVLRGDDGFGVAVARELEEHDFPEQVDVVEVGISGVSMAQELLDGYDALVLIDAMERDGDPGTLYVERAEVPDLDQYSKREIGGFAADMHQTDPSKVLVLGEALGVLPDPTILVGCEPQGTDDLEDELSDPVRAAVGRAVEHVELVVTELVDDGENVGGRLNRKTED
jgi:hydrogenase maturation protease